jgi:hypothetical protein
VKKVRNFVVCLFAVACIAVLFGFVGVPTTATTALCSLVFTILWMYLDNNRKVTNVTASDRDVLLNEAPPTNHGLVYVHRPMKVGGQAIGFDVDLDTVTVAQLKAARFTRLVVASGSHTLKAGPKKSFGQIAQANKGDTDFTISAGETVVFRLDLKRGVMQASIDIVREPDTTVAMTKLRGLTMVAPDKTADAASLPASYAVSA